MDTLRRILARYRLVAMACMFGAMLVLLAVSISAPEVATPVVLTLILAVLALTLLFDLFASG